MKQPFKVLGEIKLMTVTQRQMAAALDLSTTRTNELIDKEGILVRDASTEQGRLMLFESLQNYFLSKQATGDDSANFWKERALHERAKRKTAELNLQIKEGKLYWASEVHAELAEWLITFRTRLMGIGHKLAPQIVGLTPAQMCERIDAEIHDALTELADNVDNENFMGAKADIETAAAPDG